MAKEYCQITILFIGAIKDTKNGSSPPDIKDAPDANAACNGLGCVKSFMPSSSLAWASRALWFDSCVATSIDKA